MPVLAKTRKSQRMQSPLACIFAHSFSFFEYNYQEQTQFNVVSALLLTMSIRLWDSPEAPFGLFRPEEVSVIIRCDTCDKSRVLQAARVSCGEGA